MLSKGTELFLFEGEFFKLKKKWINEDMTEEKWRELFEEFGNMYTRYSFDKVIQGYVYETMVGFLEFMDKRAKGTYL